MVVIQGEEGDNTSASSNHTERNFYALQRCDGSDSAYCFLYSLPNFNASEGDFMYSALVFKSGNLGLVVVLPRANAIKPWLVKAIICVSATLI